MGADRSITRRVVGGGRAAHYPRLKPGDLALNLDGDTMPHVQGDVARLPFRPAAFAEVYCEKLPWDAFTGKNRGAVKEMARRFDIVMMMQGEVEEKKLLWGTDAPGLLSHATYPQLLGYITRHADFLSDADRAKILGENALAVYGGVG